MLKKVFIHIGLPKTATSSIQSFLYNGNDFLHDHGYHYIQTGLNQKLKCHHDLIWKLGLHDGLSYVQKDIQKYKDEILRDLAIEEKKYEDKDLIISSELLTFIDDFKRLAPLLEIFRDREIKFIVNLRRQDRFLESLYQQVIKDGIALTFDEWFLRSRGIANYNVLITKLLQITSKENVIIDLFDSRLDNLHPTENFLISLGFEKEFIHNIAIQNIKENESLSSEQIEAIRVSNQIDPNARFELWKRFVEDNSTASVEKVEYLDDEQRKRILDSFLESNLKLINTMGLSPNIAVLLQTL